MIIRRGRACLCPLTWANTRFAPTVSSVQKLQRRVILNLIQNPLCFHEIAGQARNDCLLHFFTGWYTTFGDVISQEV